MKLFGNLPTTLVLSLGLLLSLPVSATPSLGIDDVAPDFTLPDLSGEWVQLSKLLQRGHVLLVFCSTRCPLCHSYIPYYKKVHQEYKARGVTMVAVYVGAENRNEVEAYAFENDLDYIVLSHDEKKAEVEMAYRLQAIPTTMLIAPDGRILYTGHGKPSLDELLPSIKEE